jgi:hypothetical protein
MKQLESITLATEPIPARFDFREPVFPTVRFLAGVAEDKNHPESIR